MSTKGGPVFTFSLPGGGSPPGPPSVTPLGTGALLRVSSWPVKTAKLHRALNKHVMGVWSGDFTAAFFVSFIVTIFVLDTEGIQNKVA